MPGRGYFGVGIWFPEKECNVGTLFRSAFAFDADFCFTIGRRYTRQSSDTSHSSRHIPCFNYLDQDDFMKHRPLNSRLVCVELADKSFSLPAFAHPEQAIYLLGSEGGGLPDELMKSHPCVQIPTSLCLNVAVAGSIVLYDRRAKGATWRTKHGK